MSIAPAGAGNPVAEPLLRHLRLHSATSRITAALTVTAWLHAPQQTPPPDLDPTSSLPPASDPEASSVPQDIVLALFGCLAQPAVAVTAEGAIQPYSELSTLYCTMQKQAQVCTPCSCGYVLSQNAQCCFAWMHPEQAAVLCCLVYHSLSAHLIAQAPMPHNLLSTGICTSTPIQALASFCYPWVPLLPLCKWSQVHSELLFWLNRHLSPPLQAKTMLCSCQASEPMARQVCQSMSVPPPWRQA